MSDRKLSRHGQSKKRKVAAIVTSEDHNELKKNFTFLPNREEQSKTWQGRMVLKYHAQLYKDYVLANTTRVFSHKQLGLRWRTEKEVQEGKGSTTCGNLQCPQQHNS
eukprot:CAMPEP_0198149560 /NCGR_PEP_ID=MMETSP1443-20131203/47208_1 /TAXON_ID=186043 /ORGANISM="Entomoneis sp., Strain CCMP2396" /LENGTH=106 /DNA_ID=CAMNT_0043814641 /DNA_START=126 /DNA_END=446 /DNA_ORIENTATION=+